MEFWLIFLSFSIYLEIWPKMKACQENDRNPKHTSLSFMSKHHLSKAYPENWFQQHKTLVGDKWAATVLGRKKRALKKPHKSTSLPPIPKIFLETFYISTKLRKNFRAHPQKLPPISSIFRKNTFFPTWQKFRPSIPEKAQNRRFWGSPTSKNYFDKLSI